MSGPPDDLPVTVNGELRRVPSGATVAELVRELGQDPRAVAVEHNGEILQRAAYAETRLAAGDRLEVVRFVQGGAGATAETRTLRRRG